MPTTVDPIDPTGAIAELIGLVSANTDMSTILDEVVQFVQQRIPGADNCSITLIRDERAATVASTGPLALKLDEAQYEHGYGPCLEAGRSDATLQITDVSAETRWPKYVAEAQHLGLGSSVSLPLPVENYLVGALNVYSRRPDAFSAAGVALGNALARHVTGALSLAETALAHRDRAGHLEKAVESHSVIDQAKGIIMAQQKCTQDDAFAMLRKLSMDRNVKLYDLAAALVTSASGHAVRRVT